MKESEIIIAKYYRGFRVSKTTSYMFKEQFNPSVVCRGEIALSCVKDF